MTPSVFVRSTKTPPHGTEPGGQRRTLLRSLVFPILVAETTEHHTEHVRETQRERAVRHDDHLVDDRPDGADDGGSLEMAAAKDSRRSRNGEGD